MMKRGEIYYADLSPVVGSEQGGARPVLIIQNNIGNKFSPTVIVAPITTKVEEEKMPVHIDVDHVKRLDENSIVLLEQIRTIDKSRIIDKLTQLDKKTMKKVDKALRISVGLE